MVTLYSELYKLTIFYMPLTVPPSILQLPRCHRSQQVATHSAVVMAPPTTPKSQSWAEAGRHEIQAMQDSIPPRVLH